MLTQDERDLLDDLVTSDYWPVIIKTLEIGVNDQRDQVASTDISQAAPAIVIARSEYEGAQKLFHYMASLKRKAEKKNGVR